MKKDKDQIELGIVKQLDIQKLIDDREYQINEHIESWRICWDWDGPKEGEYAEVNNCTAWEYDNKERCYHYMAPVKLLKQINATHWLAQIDYPEELGEHFIEQNKIRLLLDILDIWPPCGRLSAAETMLNKLNHGNPSIILEEEAKKLSKNNQSKELF